MSLDQQIAAFLWTLAIGMAAGICYEVYRAVSDRLRLRKVGTFTGDIIFWTFLTVFAFFLLIRANYGQIRLYVFIGLVLGAFLSVRLLGRPAYRLVSWLLFVAGRILQLLALCLYYLWRVITFPFRVVLLIIVFPFSLAGRLFGRAGRQVRRLVNRPVSSLKGRLYLIVRKLLDKLAPPQ